MVHKVPAWVNNPVGTHVTLPIPTHVHEAIQFYSLFQKIDGRWNQIRTNTYLAEYAVKIWGDIVVSNPYSFSIRPATMSLEEARCKNHLLSRCW